MNQKPNGTQYVPGVLLAALTAGLSMVLGKAVPILGSSLFAILCGILLNASQLLPQNSRPGLAYSGKKLLQYSIILMGFTLSFQKVTQLGLSSLVISLPTISIAFLSAFAMGYLLKAPKILTALVGMGTAICGGSAIAAASPVLEADENDIQRPAAPGGSACGPVRHHRTYSRSGGRDVPAGIKRKGFGPEMDMRRRGDGYCGPFGCTAGPGGRKFYRGSARWEGGDPDDSISG